LKVVILAGGLGTRISEETSIRPKPMVEIGGKPILWHIMKMYSTQGFDEFIICLGYKGYMIKEYFANYFLHSSDVTIDVKNNKMDIHQNHSEPWKITLVDTGELTPTGGRIKRIQKYVGNNQFMLTYGDGVSDIDIKKLVNFHEKENTMGTITIAHPPPLFGVPKISGCRVIDFIEKPDVDTYINGGFSIFEPEVFKYLKDDSTNFEKDALPQISRDGKLSAFRHEGFWQCMDTIRHKQYLEELYNSNRAPWVVWE
jgi:glucose-1-phosphate cytidylyltransferase